MTVLNARVMICNKCGKANAALLKQSGESHADYALRSDVIESIDEEQIEDYKLSDNEMVEIFVPAILRAYDNQTQELFDFVEVNSVTLCQQCYQKIKHPYETAIKSIDAMFTNFFEADQKELKDISDLLKNIDIQT